MLNIFIFLSDLQKYPPNSVQLQFCPMKCDPEFLLSCIVFTLKLSLTLPFFFFFHFGKSLRGESYSLELEAIVFHIKKYFCLKELKERSIIITGSQNIDSLSS